MMIGTRVGFLLPPKTGSSWVIRAMKTVLKFPLENPFSNRHKVPENEDEWNKVPVGLPLAVTEREQNSWLKSLHKIADPRFSIPVLDALYDDYRGDEDHFASTRQKKIEKVKEYYQSANPTFVLRTEHLADDLISVLEQTGYELTDEMKDRVRKEPPDNVTPLDR